MKAELQERLAEEFPFMRRRAAPEAEPNGAIFCDCGDGWYELLRGLCAEIAAVYDAVGEASDIVVDQVKEKYGELCFYFHCAGQREPGCGAPPDPRAAERDQELFDIVRKWEDKSGTVCETCGKPGALRADLPWVQTLCDACAAARTENDWRKRP